MPYQLLSMEFSVFMLVIWVGVWLISMISSAKKQKNMKMKQGQKFPPNQNSNYPPNNQWNHRLPQFNPGMEKEMPHGDNKLAQPGAYQEPGQNRQSPRLNQPKPPVNYWQLAEKVSEDNRMTENQYQAEEEFRRQRYTFREEIPAEYVEEYVPDELGENNTMDHDQFYSSMAVKSALTDEQDIARAKVYQRKNPDAFKKGKVRQKSRAKGLFSGGSSLKKTILLSEILGRPKSLQD